MIGAFAGLVLKQYQFTEQTDAITHQFHSLFMIFLLPPIIFESGYSMNKEYFFKNLGSILIYSLLGTFMSIFLSSFMFWGMGMTMF